MSDSEYLSEHECLHAIMRRLPGSMNNIVIQGAIVPIPPRQQKNKTIVLQFFGAEGEICQYER